MIKGTIHTFPPLVAEAHIILIGSFFPSLTTPSRALMFVLLEWRIIGRK